MKVIQIHQHGGPEVLTLVEQPMPVVPAGHVLVRNRAIGVNYVDVQHRQGGYYPVQLPFIPGTEAAGSVEQIGEGVRLFKIGDSVAYAGYMGGNYADYTVVPEAQLVHIPDGVSPDEAAAGLLQGMTAQCLTHEVFPVQKDQWVLVHAAAGGVGSLLVQIAKYRGAKVIGTVSSNKKAHFAKQLGADYVFSYAEFAESTLAVTDGEGVQVVYDAIGQATFDHSLSVLRQRGLMVVYGQTSGAIPPFDINRLSGITDSSTRGSLFLTWAALSHYNTSPEELRIRAKTVFQWIQEGILKIQIHQRLPLEQAVEAHHFIENRDVIGKILLVPST